MQFCLQNPKLERKAHSHRNIIMMQYFVNSVTTTIETVVYCHANNFTQTAFDKLIGILLVN
jgi:hypothetical protein